MKKKTIKAWAVVDGVSGSVEYFWAGKGEDVYAVFNYESGARRYRKAIDPEKNLNIKIVPCIITYTLPANAS